MCWRSLKSEKRLHFTQHILWPSTKKSDGTEELTATGSVDGCSVLQDTKIVGICLLVHTIRVLSVQVPFPMGSYQREARVQHQTAFRGSTPDFSSKLSPEVFSSRGYIRKTLGV